MRHLLIEREAAVGQALRLEGQDFHYLTRVLRYSQADEFTVLDAAGETFTARITRIHDDHLDAIVEVSVDGDEFAGIEGDQWHGTITIFQALPKGRKFDEVIRQTVQAGAARIVPLVTERTVVRADDAAGARLDRWRRVAREAVQQSGALHAVDVAAPISLDQLKAPDDGLSLFLHPEPIAQRTLHGYLDRVPERLELVVGPEGGFSPDEVNLMIDRGFLPLYLGRRVLRTESAALFALGAVQMLLQERSSWQPTE